MFDYIQFSKLLFKVFLGNETFNIPKPVAVKNTTGMVKSFFMLTQFWNWDILVTVVTRLGAKHSCLRISVSATDFSFYKTSKGALGSTQSPFQLDPTFIRGATPWGVNLTTHRHLVSKLRMNRELHDYASKSWTGTTSYLQTQLNAGPL